MSHAISTLILNIEHPEVDNISAEFTCDVRWFYFPGRFPTIDQAELEPMEFDYEIVKHDAPSWVTDEMIYQELDSWDIFKIMDK